MGKLIYSMITSLDGYVSDGDGNFGWGVVGPASVGGGHRFFSPDVRVDLELLDERRFGNGVVYLRYGVTDSASEV